MTAAEHCPDCGTRLHDRSPNSPPVRRCQDCWWTHQRNLPPAERHPLYTEIRTGGQT